MSGPTPPQFGWDDPAIENPWGHLPKYKIGPDGSILLASPLPEDFPSLRDDITYLVPPSILDCSLHDCSNIDPIRIGPKEPSEFKQDHIGFRNTFLGQIITGDSGKFGNVGDFTASRIPQLIWPVVGSQFGDKLGTKVIGTSRKLNVLRSVANDLVVLTPKRFRSWPHRITNATFGSSAFWGEFHAHMSFRAALDIPWGISKELQSRYLGVKNFGYPAESLYVWLHHNLGVGEDNNFIGGPLLAFGAYGLVQTSIQYNLAREMTPALENRPWFSHRTSRLSTDILHGAYHEGNIRFSATRGGLLTKLGVINAGTYLGWCAYDFAIAVTNPDLWEDSDGTLFERLSQIMRIYSITGDMGPTLAMFTNAGHIGGNVGDLLYETLHKGPFSESVANLTDHIRWRAFQPLARMNDAIAASLASATAEVATTLTSTNNVIAGLFHNPIGSYPQLSEIVSTLQSVVSTARRLIPLELTDTNGGAIPAANPEHAKWLESTRGASTLLDALERGLGRVSDLMHRIRNASAVPDLIQLSGRLYQPLESLAVAIGQAIENDFFKYRPERVAEAEALAKTLESTLTSIRNVSASISSHLKGLPVGMYHSVIDIAGLRETLSTIETLIPGELSENGAPKSPAGRGHRIWMDQVRTVQPILDRIRAVADDVEKQFLRLSISNHARETVSAALDLYHSLRRVAKNLQDAAKHPMILYRPELKASAESFAATFGRTAELASAMSDHIRKAFQRLSWLEYWEQYKAGLKSCHTLPESWRQWRYDASSSARESWLRLPVDQNPARGTASFARRIFFDWGAWESFIDSADMAIGDHAGTNPPASLYSEIRGQLHNWKTRLTELSQKTRAMLESRLPRIDTHIQTGSNLTLAREAIAVKAEAEQIARLSQQLLDEMRAVERHPLWALRPKNRPGRWMVFDLGDHFRSNILPRLAKLPSAFQTVANEIDSSLLQRMPNLEMSYLKARQAAASARTAVQAAYESSALFTQGSAQVSALVNDASAWMAAKNLTLGRIAYNTAGNVFFIWATNWVFGDLFYEDFVPAVHNWDIRSNAYDIQLPKVSN